MITWAVRDGFRVASGCASKAHAKNYICLVVSSCSKTGLSWEGPQQKKPALPRSGLQGHRSGQSGQERSTPCRSSLLPSGGLLLGSGFARCRTSGHSPASFQADLFWQCWRSSAAPMWLQPSSITDIFISVTQYYLTRSYWYTLATYYFVRPEFSLQTRIQVLFFSSSCLCECWFNGSGEVLGRSTER